MLRASVLAILLLTTPTFAARPSQFWFDQMARENGTPQEDGDECSPGDYGDDPCPQWVIVGYDYDENGELEPVYFDTNGGPIIVPEGYTDVPVLPETPLDQLPD
jgi:hypothetical protein